MGSARYMDKDWLIDQYVTQEIEIVDIALSCKVDKSVIIRWLDEYGIYRNWRRTIDKKNKK
jgi:hypothetical protein